MPAPVADKAAEEGEEAVVETNLCLAVEDSKQRGHGASRVAEAPASKMNGHVFQCSEERSNRMQFKKTKEALQAYGKTYLKHAADLAPLFAVIMLEPELKMPQEPGPNPSRSAEMIYTEKVKVYVKCESTLVRNMATIHAVVWGQCSKVMKARLKSLDGCQAKADANDCLLLMQSIRAVTLELN